jgi:two-component system, chemotaxis family, response regulator Rcp1
MCAQTIEVLLIEDDPGDVELTQEALAKSKLQLHLSVANDGEEAIAFLRQEGEYEKAPQPDLILLDLNLPGMNGQEILYELKNDQYLKRIPVLVFTTSDLDEDVLRSYNLGASCYVTKPIGLKEFAKIVQSIEGFWFAVVRFPPK